VSIETGLEPPFIEYQRALACGPFKIVDPFIFVWPNETWLQ
jgi:hypothetical protein